MLACISTALILWTFLAYTEPMFINVSKDMDAPVWITYMQIANTRHGQRRMNRPGNTTCPFHHSSYDGGIKNLVGMGILTLIWDSA